MDASLKHDRIEEIRKQALRAAHRVRDSYTRRRRVRIERRAGAPQDILSEIGEATFRQCEPFTMTSPERMYALWQAVEYVETNNVPGDLVECGVWRGGSSMLMAAALLKRSSTDRQIYLYDTYAGMSEPTVSDVRVGDHRKARDRWDSEQEESRNTWCYASLDEVRANMAAIGYPADRLRFVEGDVVDTIPATAPDRIALLRLDTDWYESTRHELEHLLPRLSPGGVLILDDYGDWQGSRQAVDEHFEANGLNPLLTRIDKSGRIAVLD